MEGQRRVMVAMSGGVDSSVAAWLLLEQGFDVVGATMRLFDEEGTGAAGNARDIADAQAVAQRLGIPHHVIDCRDVFDHDVVEAFVQAYEHGVTPNPCALCNRRIKFGALLDHARELRCDAIATGHYAQVRTRRDPSGATVYELAKAADATKDQSYFLYSLTQEVLAHVIFPLGGLTKEGDVRRIAAELGFENARKRDSQGICFVPRNDFATFIERRRHRALPEGDVIDSHGNVLGRHRGAIRYTVGQRKGLGIAAAQPLYVTRIDTRANTVTLDEETGLFAGELVAGDWVWSAPADRIAAEIAAAGAAGIAVGAEIRYHQPDQAARLALVDHGACAQGDDAPASSEQLVRITFERPQRAIAPGQAVVVFRGDVVLGGGTVRSAAASRRAD